MSAKVVIIGAGYAGVSAAKRLARSSAQVTIVNPRADFVERIRLHQLLAGTRAATLPLSRLLPGSTTLVRDSAESIDAGQRTVTLGSGRVLDFDYLVYAVGSRSPLEVIPGAAEHAVGVGELEDVVGARRRLRGLSEGSAISVVGGGLTGVEVAAELAESGVHAVRLITDESLAASVSGKGRDYLRAHFGRLGVEVVENTAVTAVRGAEVELAGGRVLGSDLTVVAAMFAAPPLARDSGLDTDHDGALQVDRSLVSTSSRAVVGAGDASRITAAPLRMSCQAAIPLGAHAAETVLHSIRGTAPKPVRPKFTGQCISLGRRAALWQQASPSDDPVPVIGTGKVAAVVKEQICASTVRFGLNPRIKPTYSWSW